TVDVRGQLRGDLREPELIVIESDGSSERVSLGRGATFHRRVELSKPGVVRLQLLARGDQGVVPVATMPVAVGVRHARELNLGASEGSGRTSDPGEIGRGLYALLSTTRAEAGLPPLALH